MKKKTNRLFFIAISLLSLIAAQQARGQLSLTGQLRTRTEYRNGLGTLRPTTSKPAFFTSQRTRLTFSYKWNRVTFQTSLQDVRVWGQDASTISNADGNKLGTHEAWAEVVLANKKDSTFKKSAVEYLALKIGRQELLYDDSRLLGNLDWLQQGRRHDALLVKMLHKGWQLDAGFAFNQNTDAFNYNGTFYVPANIQPYVKDSKGNLVPTPAGMVPLTNATGTSIKNGNPYLINTPSTNGLNQLYKSMQFLYAAKKLGKTKLTGLFFADQFGKYKLDSVKTAVGTDTGFVYGRRYNQPGAHHRITTGLLATGAWNKSNSWQYTAGLYYQTGSDRDGNQLQSYTYTLSLSYTKKKFAYSMGWDYLSGNDALSVSTLNNRFDPLYGTPHKFWGLMDYFYVGTGSPTGGLSNPFARVKYSSSNKRFGAALDYHYFALANNQKDLQGKAINKYLGSEIDLVLQYNVNKITTLEWGFSYLAATRSMEYAKGIAPGTAQLANTWSYLQINIRPDFLAK
jgi:hypothetical protein